MSELKLFENQQFGKIRVTTIDGEPWIVAKDVAEALGYAKPRNAISSHVDAEDKRTALIQGSRGGKSSMTVISEAGMYALVLKSNLKKAKDFKRWIVLEVLPSIRKNGGYIDGQESLSDDELFRRAILIAQRKIEERDLIIERQSKKIEADASKVVFAEAVSESDNSILIGELAKILKQNGVNVGEHRLFKLLREDGFLQRNKNKNNIPTQRAMEMGLFYLKKTTISSGNGNVIVSSTPKVTGKGQLYFTNRYIGMDKDGKINIKVAARGRGDSHRDKVMPYIQEHPEKSRNEISKELGISYSCVHRYYTEYQNQNKKK